MITKAAVTRTHGGLLGTSRATMRDKASTRITRKIATISGVSNPAIRCRAARQTSMVSRNTQPVSVRIRPDSGVLGSAGGDVCVI